MLPSDALILPDERESDQSNKRKRDKPEYPMSAMLSGLGSDYLAQYAKGYEMKVNVSLPSDPEKVKDLMQVAQKIMQDTERTDCILTSIVFYLLDLRTQSECLQEITEGIFQTLLKTCELPDDLKWVCTNICVFYIMHTVYISFFFIKLGQ